MASLIPLKCIIFEATLRHTATMIFMHGLGDTSQGWADMIENDILPNFNYMKFILPTANISPVTLNGGYRMTSWHDITNFENIDSGNHGVEDNASLIQKLIDAEINAGIPASRIMIAGFSQGGAMSLYTGFSQDKQLGGIICLSGYLPNREKYITKSTSLDTPALCLHGEIDDVVRLKFNDRAMETLKSSGVTNITRKTYKNLSHSSSIVELQDMKAFMTKCIPKVEREL